MTKTALWICTGIIFFSAAWAGNPGVYLADLAWPAAEQRLKSSAVVIIPFGAGAKEHGRHLPMNADHVVLSYLTDQAVAAHDVIVVPPVLHGWLPAFRGFPGTEIANAATFIDYMNELAQSLIRHGAQRILFLNTSITNASGLPLAIVAREIRANQGVPTLLISWDDLETEAAGALLEQERGGHADEGETSVNLYLQESMVDMAEAVTDYGNRPEKNYPGYKPGLLAQNEGDAMHSETGAFGDPTLATAEKGEQILAIMTENLLEAIAGFSTEPIPARGAAD
jgi:creatinine amidohydrolase